VILISYSLVSGKRGVASTGEIRVKLNSAKARLPFSMFGCDVIIARGERNIKTAISTVKIIEYFIAF
jgi:hypothetical protein